MKKPFCVMRQGRFPFILLLLTTWMVGCSEDRAHLAPPPGLETVDFGDVYLGMSWTRQVYWINRGVRPTRFRGRLLIDPIGQGFNFSLTRDEVIQPGAQTPQVNITFTPYEEGTYRAEASPSVQAGKVYVDSIRLLGNGVAQKSGGELSLAGGDLVPTRALDFGNVLVGTRSTREFNISNSSDKAITGLHEDRSSLRSQVFRVTTPATGFFDVPPKGSVPVIIAFSPPWVNRFADAAIFRDGTGNNLAGTAVNGNGIAQIFGGDLFLTDNEDIAMGLPLNFGRVLLGSNDQRAFSIRNKGPTEITANATWARGNQGFGPRPLPPVQIPAHHRITVTITFTPSAIGPFTDAAIFAGAGGINLAATSVTGEGVTHISRGDLILLDPATGLPLEILDFGRVRIKETKTLTCRLGNLSPIAITSAGLRAGNQGFSSDVSPPVTLAPHAGLTVTITFTPPDVDKFEDAITFSDASGGSMAGVMVRGQGVKGE